MILPTKSERAQISSIKRRYPHIALVTCRGMERYTMNGQDSFFPLIIEVTEGNYKNMTFYVMNPNELPTGIAFRVTYIRIKQWKDVAK